MLKKARWLLVSVAVVLLALRSTGQREEDYPQPAGDRTGRNLLDWIGLGTGPDTDPYLAKTNAGCLDGDLAECFKSRALSSLDEFFEKSSYQLTENARILRMPETQLRQLIREPYEYSDSPRADEPEWDQLVKYGMRKVERFMKSTAIEVEFSNEVTENGRYQPRFVDEIVDEIDQIEDKKDSLFKRKQLKKLFIPLLLVLKIFKLKLLLFLPLILGLASFKKILGFLAIAIPGVIGFLRFCKPGSSGFNHNNYYNTPHYSPAGIAYQPHYKEPGHDYDGYFGNGGGGGGGGGGGIHFKEDNHAQNLAYSGYGHYRNNGDGIRAESETVTKKSILPDS